MLAFFRRRAGTSANLELRAILDDRSAHQSQPVRGWLAHKKRRRWHLNFTTTSPSWLNLVECWFSVLSGKALTNTSLTSLDELANEILDKVARGQAPLDRSTKSATRTSHAAVGYRSSCRIDRSPRSGSNCFLSFMRSGSVVM